jgi:hypothetical protein
MIGGLASGGCWGPCSLIGSETGLDIELAHTPGEGTYRLDLHADGQRLTIDYSVAGDGAVSCTAGCEAQAGNFKLAPSNFWGDVHGLTADTMHFEVRRLDDRQRGPDHLEVLVLRDQSVVSDNTFDIEYRTYEPNGEGCGEVTSAQVKVELGGAP